MLHSNILILLGYDIPPFIEHRKFYKNMKKYSYTITLQNGDAVYSSSENSERFDNAQDATAAACAKVSELVECQDCDEEDALTEGDYRISVSAQEQETRPFVVVVLVGHKPKYYFGWNIEGADYEQMKHICCAQELAIGREYKTVSAVLFQYKPEAGIYYAVHECNWTDKDSRAVADFYTPESMAELEKSLI